MPAKQFRSKKFWWVNYREKFLFLIFLALIFIFTPVKKNQEVAAAFTEFPLIKQEVIPLPSPAPYPVNLTTKAPPEDLSAYGIYIVDAKSGVPLFAKNEKESLPPASTTKLMTALVALDTYSLSDVITYHESSVSGQKINLEPGEQMTVENLLYGLLVYSGNDAAEALAINHPQGHAAFIQAMNDKAQALHLDQSSFSNAVGFDEGNTKMSAEDLSRLARVAVENQLIAKIVAIPQITISDVHHTVYHSLKSTNQLLGKVSGVSGIKTGYTEEAGENLVTMVERGDRKIIIVVLRSKDRFADTIQLIDWVFANHEWVNYGI